MTSWLWLAMASLACWTVWAIGLKWSVDRIGATATSFWANLVETMICAVVFAVLSSKPVEGLKGSWWWGVGAAILAGVFASGGIMLHNAALAKGSVSVVTAITACCPAGVACVGFLAMNDKLSGSAWLGIALVTAGIVLIGASKP